MENYLNCGNCILDAFFLFTILINFYTFLLRSQDRRNHSLFIRLFVLPTREIFSIIRNLYICISYEKEGREIVSANLYH